MPDDLVARPIFILSLAVAAGLDKLSAYGPGQFKAQEGEDYDMQLTILIAVLGAMGCLTRYFLSGWVYDMFGRGFPYGTLAVNVVGAFIIGLLMEFGVRSTLIPPLLRIGLTIGFLGGLTTFSTFSYETFRLLEGGEFMVALLNAIVSVTACLICVWLGVAAARHLV